MKKDFLPVSVCNKHAKKASRCNVEIVLVVAKNVRKKGVKLHKNSAEGAIHYNALSTVHSAYSGHHWDQS